MDKENVLEFLNEIKSKIENSSYLGFVREIKYNIENKLQQNIDTLQSKIDNPNNYIESNARKFEEIIKEALLDSKKEKDQNEEELKLTEFRIKNLQSNIKGYEKILKSIEKEMLNNEKESISTEEELKIKYDTFDNEQRKDIYKGELEQSKEALTSYKNKKSKLLERQKILEKDIERYTSIVDNFKQAEENAIDDVEIRKDENELAVYKDTLEKYTKIKTLLTTPYQYQLEDLIIRYNDNLIDNDQVKERLQALNENLKIDLDEEDYKESQAFCKKILATLRKKVVNSKNYESLDQSNDVLEDLEEKILEYAKELRDNRVKLEKLNAQIASLDSNIEFKNTNISILYNRIGKYVKTIDSTREEDIQAQIREYQKEINDLITLKREYVKEKKQVEKAIVFAMESNEKYSKLLEAIKNTIDSKGKTNIYQKEMDIEKIEDLESCLKILEFSNNMIDISLDDELSKLENESKIEEKFEEDLKELSYDDMQALLNELQSKEENTNEQEEFNRDLEQFNSELATLTEDDSKYSEEELEKANNELDALLNNEQVSEEPKVEEVPVQEDVESDNLPLLEPVEEEQEDIGAPLDSVGHFEYTTVSTPSMDNNVQIDLGDEKVEFEETQANEYKEIDGNEFVDDGMYHKELKDQIPGKIDALNSFFEEQEKELENQNLDIQNLNSDEITVNNDGEEYKFDLGNQEEPQQEIPVQEELQQEVSVQEEPQQEVSVQEEQPQQQENFKELSYDELLKLRDELSYDNEENMMVIR